MHFSTSPGLDKYQTTSGSFSLESLEIIPFRLAIDSEFKFAGTSPISLIRLTIIDGRNLCVASASNQLQETRLRLFLGTFESTRRYTQLQV